MKETGQKQPNLLRTAEQPLLDGNTQSESVCLKRLKASDQFRSSALKSG